MQTQPGMVPRITADGLKEKLRRGEEVVIVDARGPKVYQSSNIRPKGSMRIDPHTMQGDIDRLPKDKTIVTV